ncbi:MAG: galactokinase [Clostridia bacterium]|nr:galactokinase [Clostridia bacterium]
MDKNDSLHPINEVLSFFKKTFGDTENVRVFTAPGRVNLIGEHIDYCGGYVFPAALTLGTYVAIRRNETNDTVRIAATTIDGIRTFKLSDIDSAKTLDWGNYQAGVVKELLSLGLSLGGFDAVYHSTIPFGAGLSSSASIEVSTGLAVSTIFGSPLTGKELALAGQRAENRFCGVNCGIMDQFASSMGREDHAILLDCASITHKYVPLDLGDNVLVLANTCKRHALGASKYNERRQEVSVGLEEMNRIAKAHGAPKKPNLCAFTKAELKEYAPEIASDVIRKRVMHVVSENERVKEAVALLESGRLAEFGALLRDANQSIRYLYEATGEELDAIYDATLDFEGCIGSRMTGGGFGGCTVNIVKASAVEAFKAHVAERYTAATGNVPEFYVCKVGDGARECHLV